MWTPDGCLRQKPVSVWFVFGAPVPLHIPDWNPVNGWRLVASRKKQSDSGAAGDLTRVRAVFFSFFPCSSFYLPVSGSGFLRSGNRRHCLIVAQQEKQRMVVFIHTHLFDDVDNLSVNREDEKRATDDANAVFP